MTSTELLCLLMVERFGAMATFELVEVVHSTKFGFAAFAFHVKAAEAFRALLARGEVQATVIDDRDTLARRGGRPKVVYSLTEKGTDAVRGLGILRDALRATK